MNWLAYMLVIYGPLWPFASAKDHDFGAVSPPENGK
jgi:hypothetical protein